MQKVLNIQLVSEYEIYKKSVNFGLMYPFEEYTVVCDRPAEINMKNGKLHADGKPAILYRDDFSVWSLNGVRVPKEVAEIPAEKLDCKLALTEKNAEIRKEIIKKIGIGRLFKELEVKVIEQANIHRRYDGRFEYELLNFDIIDERFRPYLKMINPSTGDYHIEGVHPSCDSIKKALVWANKLESEEYSLPIVLT
jgi:hypothetical protein